MTSPAISNVIEETTLIVPGLNSSGPLHWQTWFEHQIPNAVRVIQSDWKGADFPKWASRVRREISRQSGPLLIVAHSFGALVAAQAAEDHRHRIAGALLVAPADPERFGVEELLPQRPLGFPAIVVTSSNDPWISAERAARLAGAWDADFVNLGAAGHINAESGYGPWPGGLRLLQRLSRASHPSSVHPANRESPYASANSLSGFGDLAGGPIGERYETRSTNIADSLRF